MIPRKKARKIQRKKKTHDSSNSDTGSSSSSDEDCSDSSTSDDYLSDSSSTSGSDVNDNDKK